MKLKNRLLAFACSFAMLFSIMTNAIPVSADADTCFTYEEVNFDAENDPVGFYDKLKNKLGKDAIFYNGHVYFATKAKAASSSTTTKYRSAGYQVTVSNGEKAIMVEVEKDGLWLKRLNGDYLEDGFYYTVLAIKYDDLKELCINKATAEGKAADAKAIFESRTIDIYFDGIMAVVKNGVSQGSVADIEKTGTIKSTGTLYRIANKSELAALQKIFKSTNFDGFKNIKDTITNHILTVTYYADTIDGNNVSSTTVTTNSDYPIGNNFEISKSSHSAYQFQYLTAKTASDFGLVKTGYHLKPGAEWINIANSKTFAAGVSRHPDEFSLDVRKDDASISLTANWVPNTYTVVYLADGGTGTMPSETKTFDGDYFIPKQCLFQKEGYSFAGWQLCKESDVNSGIYLPDKLTTDMVKYSSQANDDGKVTATTEMRNLTDVDGGTVYLKAIWESNEYEISLNANLPLGKSSLTEWTNKLYLLYGKQYSLSSGGSALSTIKMPTLTGYTFKGYYDGTVDNLYIKPSSSNTTSGALYFPLGTKQYATNKVLTGYWEPISVNLTLNADTTTGDEYPASQVVQAVYDKYLPTITRPTNSGYTFKGFYTEREGGGICYYNDILVPLESDFLTDATLYAYWTDEVAPTVSITMESSTWTNSNDNVANGDTDDGYKIEFEAGDEASGVQRIEIYRENENTGSIDLIYTSYGYGAKNFSYTHIETEEGAIRYKAIAYDVDGNASGEVYATCYYDKTSPTIYEDSSSYDLTSLSSVKATIEASDNMKPVLEPGLYDAGGNLLCKWEDSGIVADVDYTASTYATSATSPYKVITSTYPATANVVLPDDLSEIGAYAFYNCTSLTSVTIPGNIISVGDYAFYNASSLSSVIFKNTTCIARSTIITKLELNGSMVGTDAFTNTALIYAGLYDANGKLLCTWEESGIDVTTGNINPATYTTLTTSPYYVLTNNYPTTAKIILPNDVTKITAYAFYLCKNFTEIIIPESVTAINAQAFQGCSSLKSIELPNGITSLASMTFYGCTSLEAIYIPSSVTTITASHFTVSPFFNCSSSLTIYCEVSEKPSTWGTYWNCCKYDSSLSVPYVSATTYYGVTRDEYRSIITE